MGCEPTEGVNPHALSRSATHRPAVTAGTVWAAHPPGAVACGRRRSRANATTDATTLVLCPLQTPLCRTSSSPHWTTPLRRSSCAFTSGESAAGDLGRGRAHRCVGRPVATSVGQYVSEARYERRGWKSDSVLGKRESLQCPFETAGGAEDVPVRALNRTSCCGWSWYITGRAGDRAGQVKRTAPTSRG